jgi:hypothetical protein
MSIPVIVNHQAANQSMVLLRAVAAQALAMHWSVLTLTLISPVRDLIPIATWQAQRDPRRSGFVRCGGITTTQLIGQVAARLPTMLIQAAGDTHIARGREQDARVMIFTVGYDGLWLLPPDQGFDAIMAWRGSTAVERRQCMGPDGPRCLVEPDVLAEMGGS